MSAVSRRIAQCGLVSAAPVLQRTLDDDQGQGLGEYALILGFVAVLCVAAVAFVGNAVFTNYQAISSNFP